MLDRTQEQIMQAWNVDDTCLVSVICITYNHELYIREAIKSFLIQETKFPFEIIIHDDASTDNTPNIIKEYHSLYPDIIKPIFQQENQYSKGGFKPSIYAASFSKGKFIALCEGDDYWISKQKLQIQIEAMQEHPEVDFSFHSAYRLCNGVRDKKPSWVYGQDKILYPDTILSITGQFSPTASYILRREIIENLPEWFFETAPVGDFFLEMYGAKRGGALYIDKPMSIYRVKAVNSWSSSMKRGSVNRLRQSQDMLASLQLLKNDFPDYSEAFKTKEAACLYQMANFYLLTKNDELFKKYIEDSVIKYSFFSIKQKIFYKFRLVANILRIIIQLDSFFRSLGWFKYLHLNSMKQKSV